MNSVTLTGRLTQEPTPSPGCPARLTHRWRAAYLVNRTRDTRLRRANTATDVNSVSVQ